MPARLDVESRARSPPRTHRASSETPAPSGGRAGADREATEDDQPRVRPRRRGCRRACRARFATATAVFALSPVEGAWPAPVEWPSLMRAFDVLPGVVQQPDDMMIVQGVEREPAGARNADEPRGAEQTELVRDGGLGEAHESRDRRRSARRGSARRPVALASDPQEFEHVRDGLTVRPASRRSWSWRDGRGIGRMALLTRLGTVGVDLGGESVGAIKYEYMNICSYVKGPMACHRTVPNGASCSRFHAGRRFLATISGL